jgi:prolyl 4-hydroxylase
MVYLTSPAEGGDTFFPLAHKPRFGVPPGKRYRFPEIDYNKPVNRTEMLAVKPVAGRLLIWMSCDPDGEDDMLSLHGSMPLVDGIKWTLTNFVRNHRRCSGLRTLLCVDLCTECLSVSDRSCFLL